MTIKQVWRSSDKRAAPFRVDGYDSDYASALAACLIEINGKRILLRNGDRALWFRYEYLNKTEWTYFFYDSTNQNAYHFDAAWLERQFQSKQFGRVVPVTVTPDPDCKEFELLYFRSDGTGCINPGPYQEDFSWDALWEWPIDPIGESFELMSFLGRLTFDEWNPKRANPRIDPAALEDQPLEFINGSQEELERVTRWICHSGIGKPDSKDGWKVEYIAPGIGLNKTGGVWEWSFRGFPQLRELFNLAYEYNSFTGYHWEYTDDAVGYKHSYATEPAEVEFSFPLATQEDQSEARSELMRWLDGKVTTEERHLWFADVDVPQERRQV